jgi:ABC-type glucose/galactose transport system permease subunit
LTFRFRVDGANANNDYSQNMQFRFIETFRIESCVLGGNSLDGGIAANGGSLSQVVEQLILVDATGYLTKPRACRWRFRL